MVLYFPVPRFTPSDIREILFPHLPDTSAHQVLWCYIDLSLGRLPDPSWRRCPGRPRNKVAWSTAQGQWCTSCWVLTSGDELPRYGPRWLCTLTSTIFWSSTNFKLFFCCLNLLSLFIAITQCFWWIKMYIIAMTQLHDSFSVFELLTI